MNGFKLYVSNTTTIPPDGHLCYADSGNDTDLPNITQSIPCYQLGKYVIYYDDVGSKENTKGGYYGPIVELCYVAINGEKRPRLSDGETPKPEGKLYKMSSNDDNIKDQLKTILESMNDIKKGQSSIQKMFENYLVKTELMSSIDDKVKDLKSDIDLQ
ncbi:unnamed protein product [Mytilus coruscus]|uniref:Uncharacterized protein n=1 Tax=Mytilus coruscus TaxID=42192 RepID=A0A6J8E0V8_MYTCO|nr:unnamed protein product [Mytilus coruscus]